MAHLSDYTTCEIADALVKLNIPCYIPDVTVRSPSVWDFHEPRICGPAFTIEFVPSTNTVSPKLPADIPHHVDVAPPGSVIVVKAPLHLPNAVWGGLMSARAETIGCQAVVVEGRIRDLNEHRYLGFPVFSSGISVLGASPFARVSRVGQPVVLGASCGWPVLVNNGDMIVADGNGVVRVPIDAVDQVVQLARESKRIDDKCMADLRDGWPIAETFAKHRQKRKGQ
ncbi:RraA-like protein [Phlyctochytrium arcticum]|nr:RraA-like protein [Phlyctochytrium arcticum]